MKDREPLVDSGMIQVALAITVLGFLVSEGAEERGTAIWVFYGSGWITMVLFAIYIIDYFGRRVNILFPHVDNFPNVHKHIHVLLILAVFLSYILIFGALLAVLIEVGKQLPFTIVVISFVIGIGIMLFVIFYTFLFVSVRKMNDIPIARLLIEPERFDDNQFANSSGSNDSGFMKQNMGRNKKSRRSKIY